MDVEYIVGSKKEFQEFVNLITHQDRVAVLSHTDLDGLTSAIFMEEILEKNNIAINFLKFLPIKKEMISEVSVKLNEAEITKVFICDIGADSIDPEGLKELRQEMDVFLIDHHPLNDEFLDKRNLIKAGSDDCAALTVFDLGDGLIDEEEWNWLLCAAIFSDFSYKKIEHLKYLQSVYPNVNSENISSSIPGMNARKINSALIYYSNDLLHVYNLVKERKMDEIGEVHGIIEEEIDNVVDNFTFSAEHYLDQSLHVYQFESRFDIVSTVSNMVSKMRSGDSFVFMQVYPNGRVKVSSRNQAGARDMGVLMKSCTRGLEGASGGGHANAAGAELRVEGLEEFKERVIQSNI